MQAWTDDGVVLGVRPLGEGGGVVELFTRAHGRAGGFTYGATSTRLRPVLQTGNLVRAEWKARVAEQLGHFAPIELITPYASRLLDDPAALEGLASAIALIRLGAAERNAYPAVYDGLLVLLEALEAGAVWPALYVRFELGLLAGFGYGLDLSQCALTGAVEGLAYVSPRTGRAATAAAAGPHAPKLLRLPPFLTDPSAPVAQGDVADAFALAGHFLERRLFDPAGVGMPPSRIRLIERLGLAGRL